MLHSPLIGQATQDEQLRRNGPDIPGKVVDLNDKALHLRPLFHAHNGTWLYLSARHT